VLLMHVQHRRWIAILIACVLAAFTACSVGPADRGPVSSPSNTVGANPALPAPDKQLIPIVQVAEATGWPKGAQPTPAAGLRVTEFASGLQHPRWLHVLPNGDVLVAETNAPERPEEHQGIKGKVMKKMMAKAGAATPSADRITLLRDADRDGVAELRTVFAHHLKSPFGMALVGDRLYVANTDAVVRFDYLQDATALPGDPILVTDLPAGPLNHHWTKNLIASADGRKLYATVGSNSNIAENGLEKEEGRAAIWEIDLETREKRLFATGLRNPNGLAWEPHSGRLWTVVNERDELGNDLVPDYLTSVKDGGFYGWPWIYFGRHLDARVEPARPDLIERTLTPDYALGAHVAALGLASSRGTSLPRTFADGMFIGLHGSWNRKPPAGYKVVFVPFSKGQPSGPPVDVLTGFMDNRGKARGRPVGVALDGRGALLVADDVGNVIWRVSGP
jgi:glucose/arabinose dehydrogenase